MQEIPKEENDLLLFLIQSSCYPISKAMIRLIGKDDAILLTDLIEMHFYMRINNLIEKEGWFTKTIEDRKTSTGIKYHNQNEIINRLKKINFIETKNLGYPLQTYFRINFNEIKKQLLKIESSIFGKRKTEGGLENQGNYKRDSISKLSKTSPNSLKNSVFGKRKSNHISSDDLYVFSIYNNLLLHNILLHNKKICKKSSLHMMGNGHYLFNKIKRDNEGCSEEHPSLTFSKIKKNTFVEYWNSIDYVKGKHKNPNTKAYCSAAKKFMRLRNGTFLKYYPIDFDYAKQQKIVTTELNEKWSNKRILAVLDELSKIYLPDYWPIDKTKLSKSLDALLYNPRSKKSSFLSAAFRGINKISTSTEMQESDYRKYLDSAIVDICTTRKLKASPEQRKELADLYAGKLPYFAEQFEKIIKYDLDKYSKIKLMYGIIDIIVFFELMDRSQSNSYGHYFGTLCSVYRDQEVYVGEPSQFIKYYINWLEEIYLSRDYALKPGAIGPKSSNWPDFCICMQDVYGFPVKQSMTISRRAPRPASKK